MSEIENKTAEEVKAPAEETSEVNEAVVQDIKEEISDGAQVENDELKMEAEDAKADDSKEEIESELDQMEKDSIYQLQVMRETNNEENKEIVDDAEKKIREIFDDLRTWVKTNTEPDRLKENLQNAATQTKAILDSTREKVIEISNSEDFKKAVDGVKDFLDGTGSLIAEGLNYGKEQLCKNPKVKDVFDSVDAGIDKIRENPALHTAVDKAQEITESLTSGLFSGLRNFFDGSAHPKAQPAPAPEAQEAAPEEAKAEPEEVKGE